MSSTLEFEEKSVEKAVEKACKQLKISPEKLKYEVLSHGSSGIFGLVGSRKAKIRVVAAKVKKEVKPRAVVETTEPPAAAEPIQEEVKTDDGENLPEISAVADAAALPESAVTLAREALQKMLDAVTSEAIITVRNEKDQLVLDISGGNTAVLIGKRGQTLEAMQYLIEKIVGKQHGGQGYIEIDVEGYLENRRSNLQKLAERCAEKAVRNEKPVTIGQMNARDRRIVHLALKTDNKVRTQSMGDGYVRRLVVFPRKTNSPRS
ncbi:MAG: RNA-binding cell elongation regulator Jag/EloR [Desulfobacterales bacterium]|nr:RNA-binding cell elongation regulator Jag/EloR [Desulfobacterales bacterium]